jgi:hypothetical protein
MIQVGFWLTIIISIDSFLHPQQRLKINTGSFTQKVEKPAECPKNLDQHFISLGKEEK